VYLKGIHEDEPIKIYYVPEFTTILEYNKKPITEKKWRNKTDIKPFRDIVKLSHYKYILESEPASADDIKIELLHRKVMDGRVSKRYRSYIRYKGFIYSVEAGKPTVYIDFPEISEILKANDVKPNMNVTISIDYAEK